MRQALRFVKWCLGKIVKAATQKLWDFYEKENWFIGLIMTFFIWAIGSFALVIVYATGARDPIMDYILAVWTAMWAVFIVARLGTMAWKEFIREQNRLFNELKKEHQYEL